MLEQHTKFAVALAVVVVLTTGVFLVDVFGGTTVGVTIERDPGLAAHWTFDGPNLISNVADSSTNGNTGYLEGFTSTTTIMGAVAQGLDFDGSNDYVRVPHDSTLKPSVGMTISVWVKPDVINSFHNIYRKEDGSHRHLLAFQPASACSGISGPCIAFGINTAGYSELDVEITTSDWTDGKWHHIAAVYDGSNRYIYKDGVEIGSVGDSGSIGTAGSANLEIGRCNTFCATRELFNGGIDDVRLYDYGFTATEVQNLYNNGSVSRINKTIETNTSLNQSLVGHWTFDGPKIISNVTDSSDSGNTGYLTQDQGTTTLAGRIGQGIDLDGTNDFVSINDSASLSFGNDSTDLPFSVSAWVYIDGSLTTQRFIGKADATNDGEWLLTTTGSNLFGFFMFDQSASAFIGRTYSSGLPTGEWIHLTGTYDGSKTAGGVNLYLNGVDVDDADSTSGTYGAMESTSKEVKIGRYGSTYMDGKVDDVRIYNRELAATEVSRIYDLGNTSRVNVSLNLNPDLDDQLLFHYTFDGPDMLNGITDRSANSNTGTLNGQASTSTMPGIIGQAIDFDGSNDFVNTGNVNNTFAETAFSLSAWFKTSSTAIGSILRSANSPDADILMAINHTGLGGGGYANHLMCGARKLTGWTGQTIDSTTTVNNDEWHHGVCVYDGTDLHVYVDGIKEDTVTSIGTPETNSGVDWTIGTYTTASQIENFDGLIDDPRVYEKALSDAEINRLYDLGR